MKRILSLTLLLLISAAGAFAQNGIVADKQTVLFFGNAVAILLTIWIVSAFVLSLVRMFLTDRLRRTLLDKNASEETITQILPPKNDVNQLALKWCCLFAAAAAGLTICYFSQPIGLHWAIIISFSLAVGLLAFYLISKRINKTS